MEIKEFWVVTKPTPFSVLQDVCFQSDWKGIILQSKGGLNPDEVMAVFDNQIEAVNLAEELLGVGEDTITVTLGNISRNHDWEKFCEVTGTSYWAMNEGGNPDADVVLKVSDARKIGLIV